jgi:hypothetical protein
MFGPNGLQAEELNNPWTCCVSESMIYVTEFANHRVSVFDVDGKYMFNFGSLGS